MLTTKIVLKRFAALAIATAMTAGTLAGCGKAPASSGGAATTQSQQPKKPVEVKLILPYSDEVPNDNNPVLPELNKVANADLKIEWTPMISYNDKFNVLVASNQLPDALIIPDLKFAVYVNGARAGMFWQLDSYLDKYPNYKNLNPIAVNNSKTDGKLFVFPRERIMKRKLVAYRADWAKQAGLKAPDSIQGIYEMAKAFANADYDGNGKKDTIGFLLGTVNTSEIDCFNELVVAMGGFSNWGVKDGKVIPSFMTKEHIDTLKWLKKMYDEKLISTDFAITKTTQLVTDFVNKEKAGLWLNYGIPGTADPLLKQKQQADPKVKRSDIYEFTYMKGPDGKPRIPAESGVSGGFAFPKQTVKDEARLKDLLSVFDKLMSKEGQRLINNGLEGKHYNIVEGDFIKSIDANINKKEVVYGQLGTCGNLSLMTADDDIGMRLQVERNKFATSDLIPDVTAPFQSDAYTTNKANLDKIINEAQFKFIMGQISEDQLNQAIDQWRKTGGDKVIEEYTAEYNKTKK